MVLSRIASFLFFFLLLSEGFAWACDLGEVCRPDDPTCEARKKSCVEFWYKHYRKYQYSPGKHMEKAPTVHKYMRKAPTATEGNKLNGEIIVGGKTTESKILASRLFVGRHDYPPEEYGAYGIVAFPTLSTPETKDRYQLVCQAYLASLPPSSDLKVSVSKQMVTVWPVDDPKPLFELSDDKSKECEYAVAHYDLTTALWALAEARDAGAGTLDGDGPYLLAWSPSGEKGEEDALVLVLDMSSATLSQYFKEQFVDWRTRIEQDPSLWYNGFSLDGLRVTIKYWVDRWGTGFLSISK
jgi:hypothetical protein